MNRNALFVVAAAACTLAFAPAQQQRTTITGKVVDRGTGAPLEGVVVQVKETSLGAITKPDGTYAIERVPLGKHVIRISRIGYEPFESKRLKVTTNPHVVDGKLTPGKPFCIVIVRTGLNEPGAGMLAPYSTAIIRFD